MSIGQSNKYLACVAGARKGEKKSRARAREAVSGGEVGGESLPRRLGIPAPCFESQPGCSQSTGASSLAMPPGNFSSKGKWRMNRSNFEVLDPVYESII